MNWNSLCFLDYKANLWLCWPTNMDVQRCRSNVVSSENMIHQHFTSKSSLTCNWKVRQKQNQMLEENALTATPSPGSWALSRRNGCSGNADGKDGLRQFAVSWAYWQCFWWATGWDARAGRGPPRSRPSERSLSRCNSPRWKRHKAFIRVHVQEGGTARSSAASHPATTSYISVTLRNTFNVILNGPPVTNWRFNKNILCVVTVYIKSTFLNLCKHIKVFLNN